MPGDGFDSLTESTPLVSELRERIRRKGPITFREFMEAALYHPKWGYYVATPKATSRDGDYVTSPEVHPVFGAMLGRQLREIWERLERPRVFDVVEQGAGRGMLAASILGSAGREDPAFAASLRYTIVEPSERLRMEQQRTLGDIGHTAIWSERLPDRIGGVVLTNELLDAFAVHRVVLRGDELLEVYVGLDGGRFVDHLAEPSTPALRAYFDTLGLLPGDDCYAEVNLEASRWIAQVSASLERGYVLTFDYGHAAAELYAPWRRDGTLLCFYKQSASSDPYQRIGKQDLTASVDLTTLQREGEAAGLRTLGLTDQASFLIRLGIAEGVANVAHERPREMEEYFARRGVIMELIDPAGLGRIKVLAQGRNVPDTPLRGFRDD